MFDRDKLRKLLAGAGLVLTRPWVSEIDDCAAYPISLNLEARKPHVPELTVSGAMSVPRLGFMDNLFSLHRGGDPLQREAAQAWRRVLGPEPDQGVRAHPRGGQSGR
jgi:hypothetical protein